MIFLNITLLGILLFALAFILASLVQSLMFRRSFMASAVDIYLRLTARLDCRNVTDRKCKRMRARGERGFKIPHVRSRGVKRTVCEMCGRECLVFTPEAARCGTSIIYLFGGGYFRNPRRSHIRFLCRLAKDSGCKIIAPIYPRAPFYDYRATREYVLTLYLDLISTEHRFILMGDSSGGGLSVLLLQMLQERGVPLPSCAVLLSPWVDISLSHKDTAIYERRDPLLTRAAALYTAGLWASSEPLNSPQLSPLYGDISELCPIHIFIGEREMLYPQGIDFYKKLASSSPHCTLTVGKGLNHVYPIYPIREAKVARAKIVEKIKPLFTNNAIYKH